MPIAKRVPAAAAMAAMAVLLSASAGLGQEARISPAHPDTWPAVTGEVLLHFVAGRSLQDAGGPAFNPFGIDGEGLLFSIGAFFVTTEFTGEPVHEGEIAIFPQFETPQGAFTASAETPAIIPFAMVKSGACEAGFIAGHPVPDRIFAVDLTDQICHAATVEQIVYAQYAAAATTQPEPQTTTVVFDPAQPQDADLDVAVWAAYHAAYARAVADPDYLFTRGGFQRVAHRHSGRTRQGGPAGDCRRGGAGRRDGRSLRLRAGWHDGNPHCVHCRQCWHRHRRGFRSAPILIPLDPAISDDLQITYARDCAVAGLGRAAAANVP